MPHNVTPTLLAQTLAQTTRAYLGLLAKVHETLQAQGPATRTVRDSNAQANQSIETASYPQLGGGFFCSRL